MTLPTLTPGSLFALRWIVGRVLGRSELGLVYEVEAASQARFAALKLLDPALTRDEGALGRFQAAARALAELPGDGIARSYDVGVSGTIAYVASERCVFPSLSRYVAERGALPPRAFLATLSTLAGALDATHAAGIVHGNLKPQNVFVSFDNSGWARLTDFGLAELRAASGVKNPRTLGWTAPEVDPAPSTPASDLYTLGLLSFFALTGSPWWSAQRGKTASGPRLPEAASERARALGGTLPPAFDSWFSRALSRAPAERFSNASELLQAFRRALDESEGSPESVHPLSETVPVRRVDPLLQAAAAAKRADAIAMPERTLEVTSPLAARAGAGSIPARPVSTPPPPGAPATRTTSPAAVTPPLAVVAIVLGGLTLAALVVGAVLWLIAR